VLVLVWAPALAKLLWLVPVWALVWASLLWLGPLWALVLVQHRNKHRRTHQKSHMQCLLAMPSCHQGIGLCPSLC